MSSASLPSDHAGDRTILPASMQASAFEILLQSAGLKTSGTRTAFCGFLERCQESLSIRETAGCRNRLARVECIGIWVGVFGCGSSRFLVEL
ncbi:MAG: hypothetical protein CMJ64_24920, partial [Planctomycetaceae bacterium]|nr:hypothetical protein [Planctomycetaceae bacterium]